jgi:TP901 family phage tail tape measure protein
VALKNDLRVRIDAEFPGEGSFKSAEASAKTLARELQKVEDATRAMAAAEFAAYREGEKRVTDHEAAVRKMASVEVAAYKEMQREAEQARAARNAAMADIGKASLAAGAVALAGVGLAVKGYADLESQLSSVRAATHANAETMALLKDAAIEAGASTVYSATEAAQAEEELAKAGVSVADILGGGLAGALDLAAAGQLEVADAAGIVAVSLGQYGLAGDQASHVADLLAAGANKAMGEVGDLANALKYVGPVAAGMNVSIEETVGTLAAFAQQGIIGEQAGTSLRGMLSSLTSPSKAASLEIEALGINLYDTQGNFLGLQNAAGELARAYGPMTDAQRDASLGTIFGNEQVTAARVLYKTGAEGVAEWTQAVDASGFAAQTAAIKLDNLKGDAEKLAGALQTALISSGELSSGGLRVLTQDLTTLIDMFNEAPDSVQDTATVLGGVGGAVALAGGAALVAIPQVTEFYDSLGKLGTAGTSVQRGLGSIGTFLTGPWGLALAAAVGVGALFVKSQVDAKQRVDQLAGSLEGQTGAITDNTRAIVAKRLEEEGVLATAGRLGLSLDVVTDAALGQAAALRQVNDAIAQGRSTDGSGEYVELADGTNLATQKLIDLKSAVGSTAEETEKARASAQRQAEAIGEQGEATGAAGDASEGAAAQIAGLTAAGEESAEAISGLGDAMKQALGIFFDVETATSAAEQAVDGLSEAVKDNGASTDLSTDKGRANAAALRERVETSADLIAALAREGHSSEELSARTQKLKDDFTAQMRAAGFSEEAISHYAEAFDNIPAAVSTLIKTEGLDQMSTVLANVLTKVEKLDGRTITTRFQTSGTAPITGFGGAGQTVARSAGGAVRGSGTTVSDSIPALLSDDEHVITASEVRAAGGHEAVRSWRASVLANPARHAIGGPAGSPAGPSVVSYSTVMSGLTERIAPVSGERYNAALLGNASAAAVAAESEKQLDAQRRVAERTLDRLKTRMEGQEEALKERQDAAEEAMAKELAGLKKNNGEAERLLKERNDEAERAFKQRNDDELDALRSRTKDQKRIKDLERRQEAEERALADRNAQAERDLAGRHANAEEAAQERIAEAKKKNAQASKDLSKINDSLYDLRKKMLADEEAKAEEANAAAKEAAKKAADELAEAERQLNEARQRAVDLAKEVASTLMGGAGLDNLFGDTSVRDLDATARALEKAAAAADLAVRNVRGEDAAAGLERRSSALAELVTSATAYAAAQEAMGVSDTAITAGLDQVGAKVRDLGAAYGLTADQVAELTGQLQTQRTSASDLLASRERELARATEMAAAIKSLQSAGLNGDLLDQVRSGGTGGLALARSLLARPELIGQFNANQAALVAVSNDLGATIADARYGATTGGSIAGYGATMGFQVGGAAASAGSVTLDAATSALLQRVLTAVTNRPTIVQFGSERVATAVNQVNADVAYGKAP